MIKISLQHSDYKQIRFAISPSFELAMAFRTLLRKPKDTFFAEWSRKAAKRIEPGDYPMLESLIRAEGYLPDFLTPPPKGNFSHCSIQDDISTIRNTPAQLIVNDVEKIRQVYGLEDEIYNYLKQDTKAALRQVAHEMHEFWTKLMLPYWGKYKSYMESDILHRAKNMAYRGIESVFDDLGKDIEYKNGIISITKKHNTIINLNRKGLILIPSIFAHPHVYVICDKPWTPAIIYPVYHKRIFFQPRLKVSDSLQTLAGSTVAIILQYLDYPYTTLELAASTRLTPGAVSQHLGKLYETDLVNKFRDGKQVYYVLSDKGRAIVDMMGDE